MARDEYLAQERVNHEDTGGVNEGSWGWIEWWDHAMLREEYLSKGRAIEGLREPTLMRTYGVVLWESETLLIISSEEQVADESGPGKYRTSTAILKKEICRTRLNSPEAG